MSENLVNPYFQSCINGHRPKRPPVWFMRQAGRYQASYQKIREKHSFVQLCKQPELATQVALSPIKEFGFDVAILFSDILFPLEALGMNLEYNPGPVFEKPLTRKLYKDMPPASEAVKKMQFQEDALRQTRETLNDWTLKRGEDQGKSLIGFVGGPWTLFSYATRQEKNLSIFSPEAYEFFLEFYQNTLMPFLEKNIQMQQGTGAEVVMIFDTVAGRLPYSVFEQYREQVGKLARYFPKNLMYFCKDASLDHYKELEKDPWLGFGFDANFCFREVFESFPSHLVQGNFDNRILQQARGKEFQSSVNNYLQEQKRYLNETEAVWICGLGHGVLPQTPEENIRYFMQQFLKIFS